MLDGDLAGAHVDLDLREVSAERPQRELGVVWMTTSLADHGVVVDLSEDLGERSARPLGHDHASLQAQLGLGRFEDPGGRAQQLLACIARRDAYRGADRSDRERSCRYRAVGIVGVTQAD